MASESAPEAFSAKFSARRASAAPNADAWREYRLRAPTGLPSAFSGRARHDRIAVRGRLGLELGPARLFRGVLDAHHVAVPHGMQARPVVEFVLHLVHPRRDLVAARHGDRPPAGLHRHPARQPAADQAGRHHRHLVQELLDALGAEQRAVQFPEVSGVSDFFSVCSRHGIAFVSFPIIYPQLARQTRPRQSAPCVELALIAECYQIRPSRTVWHVTDGAEHYDHRDVIGRRYLARCHPAGRGSHATPQCLMELQ